MIDFNERAIPGVTSNFLMQEAYARYKFASKYIKKGDHVLDVACGVGYGTDILAKKAGSAIGIDIDRETVVYAQQNFSQNSANFILSAAESTPFKDGYFGTVVSFEMIEHLQNPGIFLKEMVRITKKGGFVIVSTPNKEVHSVDGKPMSIYHTKEFSYQELSTLLKKYFKSVEFYSQTKSNKSTEAWKSFMTSQTARRGIVRFDILGIRHLVTKDRRERLWKVLGAAFGRERQESLSSEDFPIKKYTGSAEYFIAVCRV